MVNQIDVEMMEMFPCCQECSHEWEEHFRTGCSHEYCSCPFFRTENPDDDHTGDVS